MFQAPILRVSLVVAALASGVAQAAEPSLGLSLSRETAAVTAAEGVNLTLTIRNDGAEALYVLARETPARGLRGDLFEVRRDGEPVAYVGPQFRFGAPREVDYLAIAPGSALRLATDLEGFYDVSRSGTYTVRYRGLAVFRKDPEKGFVAVAAVPRSRALRLAVDRIAEPAAAAAPARDFAAPASLAPVTLFCTSSQRGQILQALPLADQMATKALTTLNNGIINPPPPTYTTWFGSYNATLYLGVLFDFADIQYTLRNRLLTYVCDCFDPELFAYTNKAQEGTTHLCPLFWSSPLGGLNSKADTIVHETSHWPNWGGDTDDHAAGISACKVLAQIAPGFAVDNADSFAYFAASQP